MKVISRDHNFSNRMDYVERGRKYFYLWHEKSKTPVKIPVSQKGISAFQEKNWDYFLHREAEYFGGVYEKV
jgi:hypothetical protein